jgi:hypothetical protein
MMMPRTPEELFWIEVIAALKLVISAIQRYKLGKVKQPSAREIPAVAKGDKIGV